MSDQVQRVETVWITGASGFLGRYMVAALQAPPRRWEIVPINRSFHEQMKNAWKQGRTVTLFRDEFRNPIAAELTARAVRRLMEDGRSGLFHVAGRERWSRLEMGAICQARYGADAGGIVSGTLKEFDGPRRAPDTTLNCRKVQRLLPFPLLGLKEWLASNPEAPF